MSYIYLISLEGLQIVKKKTQFDLPYPGTRGCVFTGRDKVNAKILKDSSPVIAPTIASLINNAFLWAVFHFLGKKLKSFQFLNQGTMRNLRGAPGETNCATTYFILGVRNGSSQFVNFLDSSNIIQIIYQSGNSKFHSTESALLYFTDEWLG